MAAFTLRLHSRCVAERRRQLGNSQNILWGNPLFLRDFGPCGGCRHPTAEFISRGYCSVERSSVVVSERQLHCCHLDRCCAHGGRAFLQRDHSVRVIASRTWPRRFKLLPRQTPPLLICTQHDGINDGPAWFQKDQIFCGSKHRSPQNPRRN